MRFRNSRLRTKVTALLVSLAALWAFAAWVTLREGINLLWVSTLDSHLAAPTDPLLAELQQERRLSVIRLVNPGAQQRAALEAQRARTNSTRATAIRLASDSSVRRAASDTLEQRIDETLSLLNGLDSTRRSVDSGSIDRDRAVAEYSSIIESVFRMYDSLATLDDKQFAKDTDTSIEINRMWEVLSQEDALMAGALVSGRFTVDDRTRFTQIVGVRRFNTDRVLLKIQAFDPVMFKQLATSAKLARVQALEDQVIQRGTVVPDVRTRVRLPVTAQQWTGAAEPALAEMRQIIQGSGDRLVERAKPIAAGVILRLLLAGGLGLFAVIASIIVSITTARALVAQLEKLRQAALELAERRLPGVVERLGRGEEVDVAAEAPPLTFGPDVIGQVGRSFNVVQETAIRSAVEQAELRRGIRDILLSLARRTQTLVHRQLTLLDRMERREVDTAELQDLFRVDHLATRMRRNAENLIVLSGATPARGWRRAVPMMDVVRAAVAEIEDYTRVSVLPMGDIALAGRAVGDITHLLAELIENAVSFSPPPAMVQVGAQYTARGYAIEIEDRGLGMTEERLAATNARIENPPEFNLSRSVQLGLYVVGRLAQRYGLRVTLKNSAYGGTTAVVLIPNDLLIEHSDVGALAEAGSPERVAVAAVAAMENTPAIGSGGSTQVTIDDAARRELMQTDPHDEEAETFPPELPSIAPSSMQAPATELPYTEPPSQPPSPQPTAPPPVSEPGPEREPTVVDAATLGESQQSGMTEQETPGMPTTPAGLPFRVPQASLAPSLRTDGATSMEQPEADDTRRSPEEVRRLVGSYLTGTSRGRSDAARARHDNAGPSAAPPTLPPADDEPPE